MVYHGKLTFCFPFCEWEIVNFFTRDNKGYRFLQLWCLKTDNFAHVDSPGGLTRPQKHPRNARVTSAEELGTISKNNLRSKIHMEDEVFHYSPSLGYSNVGIHDKLKR